MKKENNIKTDSNVNILEIIELISEKARKSQLDTSLFKDVSDEFDTLARFLRSTYNQVILFVSIFTLNFRKKRVSVDALASYLDMSGIKLLKYLPELQDLQDNRWIRSDRDGNHRNSLVSDISYYVTRNVTERIMNNEPEYRPEKFKSIYQLLATVMQLSIDFDRGLISHIDMSDEASELVEANIDLPYLQVLRQSGLSWEEEMVFMLTSHRMLTGENETDLEKVAGIACGGNHEAMILKRSIIDGSNKLISSGLMKLEDGMFMQGKQIIVTDHAVKTFFKEDADLLVKTDVNKAYLTPASEISSIPLYFNDEEKTQISRLQKLLTKKGYREVTGRLKKKNMRGGFTVLLHGSPGTGKTEAVMQLARRSGRDIMKVDISQSKSMWFGESEKKIKNIFTRYNHLYENMEHAPILFFNEADAIFGMRQELTESASTQTFNAMQNILLDEMERFNGILIATTNMTTNFDRAFERRFLFKVSFSQPDHTLRKKIWKAKLPEVASRSITILSEKYDLSGGQIENIARKYEIDLLLNGSEPGLEELAGYCEQERLSRNKQVRVGFKK